jgi:hypothetical protein
MGAHQRREIVSRYSALFFSPERLSGWLSPSPLRHRRQNICAQTLRPPARPLSSLRPPQRRPSYCRLSPRSSGGAGPELRLGACSRRRQCRGRHRPGGAGSLHRRGRSSRRGPGRSGCRHDGAVWHSVQPRVECRIRRPSSYAYGAPLAAPFYAAGAVAASPFQMWAALSGGRQRPASATEPLPAISSRTVGRAKYAVASISQEASDK